MKCARFVLLAALASGLLTFFGCESANDTTDPTGETGTVRGWVRHRYSQQGVAGANVTCGLHTTTSEVSGRFELAGIPLGTASLTAAAADFQPLQVLVEVGSFQTVMLNLVPLDTLADISGVIRHPVHGPIDAAVELDGRHTVADPAGRWALADIPLGQRSLVISHSAYVVWASSIAVHGDGQVIPVTLQRDSTYVAPVTADAGIHWSPGDGDGNNYGDDVLVSLRQVPPRSLLIAVPAALDLEGASVHAATLHLYGYLETFVFPLPDSVSLELRPVYGVWHETSVDATNFPAEVGSRQSTEATLEELDPSVHTMHLSVDVLAMFVLSPAGPPSGILVSIDDDLETTMSVYTREASTSDMRPWLLITERY